MIWVILMAKENRKQKMEGGRSKYLRVWIFSTGIQVSLQPKELSLDEDMIPWCGHLKFRMCSPGKITMWSAGQKCV